MLKLGLRMEEHPIAYLSLFVLWGFFVYALVSLDIVFVCRKRWVPFKCRLFFIFDDFHPDTAFRAHLVSRVSQCITEFFISTSRTNTYGNAHFANQLFSLSTRLWSYYQTKFAFSRCNKITYPDYITESIPPLGFVNGVYIKNTCVIRRVANLGPERVD